MTVLYIIIGMVLFTAFVFLYLNISDKIKYRPLRPEEPGTEYVHIDYDGSVQELYPEEAEAMSDPIHRTESYTIWNYGGGQHDQYKPAASKPVVSSSVVNTSERKSACVIPAIENSGRGMISRSRSTS